MPKFYASANIVIDAESQEVAEEFLHAAFDRVDFDAYRGAGGGQIEGSAKVIDLGHVVPYTDPVASA